MSKRNSLKETPVLFQINQCEYENCRFRFPTTHNDPAGERCPKCGRMAVTVTPPFSPHTIPRYERSDHSLSITLLLDNIRSALNVGSIFRSAEACRVEKIILGGISPSPDEKSFQKTALHAQETMPWDSVNNAVDCVRELKQAGYLICSLEGGERSQPVHSLFNFPSIQPILMIVGNEVSGVDPDLLELSDLVFHLPMYGEKQSFNVAVAAGIALYIWSFYHYSPPREEQI